MTAKDVYDLGFKNLDTAGIQDLLVMLRAANSGALEDVQNTNGCAYYLWSSNLMKSLQPKQIVELGGAMGVWDLCVLRTLNKENMLYSVTLPENGLEFSYVVDTYPNFVSIIGDDLDMRIWTKDLYPPVRGCNLEETDLWFFDSLHTEKQLQAELKLYTPFFKKGAIILFDDIHMGELWPIWKELPYDKFDATDPLHWSGFGIAVV